MADAINLSDYMTITEAVARIGRNRQTIYNMYRAAPWEQPRLRSIRVSGRVLVLREDVERVRRELAAE